MFELEENVSIGASIKVVGVGGGGSNAVTTMIESGMTGVDFVVANTDIQALNSSKAGQKIQLGLDLTKGLGAGANPDVGRRSAIESYNEIVEQLKGSDMVFVTAGMGGGTGTGGAPIVAKVARELGALTIGVVTKPFMFEGKKRSKHADAGLAELRDNVDALIVIPNQKLLTIAAEKTPLLDTFKKADEVLLQAVKGISNLINIRGLINLDFADIRTVMANKGLALMGTGAATGENRAIEAATQAISSPLLENVKIDGATGIIINVTGGSDLSLYEVNEASTLITEAASEDAEVIFGAVIDPTLNDEVRVTVIATGFARDEKRDSTNVVNNMHSFLGAPTLTFDLGQNYGAQNAAPATHNMNNSSNPMANMTQEQMMMMMQQMQAQMAQQSMQNNAPTMNHMMPQAPAPVAAAPAPFVQNPEPVHVLPPIENVQESVKTFAAQETTANTNMPNMIETASTNEPQFSQDFSSAVSPVATNTMENTTTTARDMLLAKAKAFRETQLGAAHNTMTNTIEEKPFHPEQLSMMDDQKQVEEAKKMARDILEVPAFIRKKQGFDLQQG
jgi:cell division protein FtsZ